MGHPSGKCRWLKEGVIWQKSNRFFARAEVRRQRDISPCQGRFQGRFMREARFIILYKSLFLLFPATTVKSPLARGDVLLSVSRSAGLGQRGRRAVQKSVSTYTTSQPLFLYFA